MITVVYQRGKHLVAMAMDTRKIHGGNTNSIATCMGAMSIMTARTAHNKYPPTQTDKKWVNCRAIRKCNLRQYDGLKSIYVETP